MIKLHNKFITAKIEEKGAEIKSIVCEGHEILWQGEETSWARTAPTLFPFCGGFKDGKYIYNGVIYNMNAHGFAKDREFTVEKKSKRSVTLLLKSDEDTLAVYPFQFELRVIFTISLKSVIVEYDVKNNTDGEMYFSIGSHESYECQGGVENYDVHFKKRESLINCIVDGKIIGEKTEQITKFSKILPIYERFWENDSVVLKNLFSRSAVLRNRINGKRIKIDFPGFNYFVIWSLPGKEYVCLEPWAGFPDTTYTSEKIEDRIGIIRLKKNGRKKLMHKITVLENL